MGLIARPFGVLAHLRIWLKVSPTAQGTYPVVDIHFLMFMVAIASANQLLNFLSKWALYQKIFFNYFFEQICGSWILSRETKKPAAFQIEMQRAKKEAGHVPG